MRRVLVVLALCAGLSTAHAAGTNLMSLRLQGYLLPYSQITTQVIPPVVTNTVYNEWYGPFPSWTNVTAFGAACDGVTDDSTAVSNALASIGNGHCSPVLLIPGMCRITHKAWLSQRRNVAVVGLNRDTCGFLYDGGTVTATYANNSGSATCFHVDGAVNCYFARLKFDGNFKAQTVLASSQQQFTVFDNNNLYEDCIFKNSAPGRRGDRWWPLRAIRGFLQRGICALPDPDQLHRRGDGQLQRAGHLVH